MSNQTTRDEVSTTDTFTAAEIFAEAQRENDAAKKAFKAAQNLEDVSEQANKLTRTAQLPQTILE